MNTTLKYKSFFAFAAMIITILSLAAFLYLQGQLFMLPSEGSEVNGQEALDSVPGHFIVEKFFDLIHSVIDAFHVS